MAIPQLGAFPAPPLLGQDQTTFNTNASATLSYMFTWATEMNAVSSAIDSASATINTTANQVSIDKASVATYTQRAESAANRAEAVVIPTEATFNYSEIGSMVNNAFSGIGFTKNISFSDAFTLGNTANTFSITGDDYWFGDKLVSVPTTNMLLPDAPATSLELQRYDVVLIGEGGSFIIEQSPTPISFAENFNGYTWSATERCYMKDTIRYAFIINVFRRNQGIATITSGFNPNGTKLLASGLKEYTDTTAITSLADCFDVANMTALSGSIGQSNGRVDGLEYDRIHESDLVGFENRMSAHDKTAHEMLAEFNNAVSGDTRGLEGEWETARSFGASGANIFYDYTTSDGKIACYVDVGGTFDVDKNLIIGDVVQVSYYNGTTYTNSRGVVYGVGENYFLAFLPEISSAIATGGTASDGVKSFLYSKRSTRTKSNTLLHCDIIGKIS